MLKASTSIILDNRRPLKDGTYPVKLRIIFNRKTKYYGTKYSLTEEDFAKVQSPKPRGDFKDLSIAINAIEQKAIEIIDKLLTFSFEAFEKRFNTDAVTDDIFCAYDAAVDRLKREGQIGTSKNYESASTSILSFVNKEPLSRNKGMTLETANAKRAVLLSKKKPLPFTAITPEFLREYDKWMVANDKTTTTISMYLRTLRTLFNEVIATGDVHADLYPFGKRKYQIPAGKNIKKALTKQEIAKIFSYQPKQESEAKARDYWCFSYLCNGINLKDIARLRYRQVSKDAITFIRAKTERTTRHAQKVIKVPLLTQAAQVIERWGNKPALPETFVFPILTKGLSPERELAVVRQTIKTINKYMKRIAAEVGIEKNVSTYTARHSFSTVLKRAGVSTAMISEALGHSSEKTTQNYLDSFEDDVKLQIASHLTDF